MYKEFIRNFNLKIEKLKSSENFNLHNAIEGIKVASTALNELYAMVDKFGFSSKKDEIEFFKNVKSQPLSDLIFFNEVRICLIYMPKIGRDNKLIYLNHKVSDLNVFFNRHQEFAQYVDYGLDYLDNEYFTRKDFILTKCPIIEYTYSNPKYFTTHDVLLAKVKGLSQFSTYLDNLIKKVKLNDNVYAQYKGNKLVWTASKTALAELVYALYTSSAINNGNEGIKTITAGFEYLFNVKLDNIYKTYSEIKMRKGKRAKFLEELTISLNHKINDDDAL